MSSSKDINKGYGSFFRDCAQFAFSPYTETFKYVARCDDNYDGGTTASYVAATAVCVFLSTCFPILPFVLDITLTLAIMGAILGAVSFPFAHCIYADDDCCTAAP